MCLLAITYVNQLGEGLDELKYYSERSIIQHGADPKHADLYPGSDIIVGRFVEQPRPTFLEQYEEQIIAKNKFQAPIGKSGNGVKA